ncbi:MAG: hypothetical protein H6595_08465 [Flavobacteriales bacterium]|nr:hypothetical protein [Flavobacteriales bacterium]MCB9167499.1 hypothetical protein [Flavobacteriales bacterium]
MSRIYKFADPVGIYFISCATAGGLDLFLRGACGDLPAQAATGRDASSILRGRKCSVEQ